MPRPLHRNLTVQVLLAIALGAAIGVLSPEWGIALEPLGKAFIRLVKMIVAPIVFLTIVVGIASMGDLKKVGRVGGKALIYFEVVTTLALAIGLLVANVWQPGANMHATVTAAAAPAKPQALVDVVLQVIPDNIFMALAQGDLLQILFFAVLFGVAMIGPARQGSDLLGGLEHLTAIMFRIVAMIMKVAPLGAFGAMAYTVGKFGTESLLPLARLMACVYLTMAVFVFFVLGSICRLCGFRLTDYLRFIKDEILLVLGTSSSESALPRMIEKLELLGCSRRVVGLVIPAGYSFNLDGTSIYLSMAVLFISQAYDQPLGAWQQLHVLVVLMLTSKGSATVTGAGFVTLAAVLTSTGVLPVEGLALLLGVDRFMSEARAITNLIGNGVATIVVSKWEGEFDESRYQAAIHGHALDAGGGTLSAEVAADLGQDVESGDPDPGRGRSH
jgi:aerobic C4-dicarboxylate transport protein